MNHQLARPARRATYDGVLWALLALLFLGVVTFDRSSWPSLIGDEATYLMAAESLAWDGDLLYERQDFDRFVEHWGIEPEGLILQSGDGGEHITFGKPFFYPLWVAPFTRLWPTTGPFLANFLVLALAALAATRTLRQTVGATAPLWVAAFLFASVCFAYTFWAHADLFLMGLTAIGFSLAFWKGPENPNRSKEASRATVLRWMGVGALLAIVGFSRPLYVPLFLPVVFALPKINRWQATVGLLIGSLGLGTGAAVVHRLNSEAWTSYGAQRRGFYSETGFPAVQIPVEAWSESLDDLGDAAWAEARSLLKLPPMAASLWGWNGVYFTVGRHIGVLPYFLPLILGLFGRPRGWTRWMLLVAVGISIAGFFLYRPFNIYGGGGAIANRYFMPLYPAFWFLATRPGRPRRVLAVFLLAAPFLWPLWSAPRSFPKRTNHTYRYVSDLAGRMLPYETTQSHLKPAGHSDVVQGGVWIKFLTRSVRPRRDGRALLLDRGSRGALLVGSPQPLSELYLQILQDPVETLEVVSGAQILSEVTNARGRLFHLRLAQPRARHPMWWTWDTYYVYELALKSDSTEAGRLTFTLRKSPARERGKA